MKHALTPEQGFIQGVAYAVAYLIRHHDEPMLALELLYSTGYTFADLEKAKCDLYDLSPIRQALRQEGENNEPTTEEKPHHMG